MARKSINTTIEADLMRKVKIIAFNKDCKINDLMEEGLNFIIEKYKDDLHRVE